MAFWQDIFEASIKLLSSNPSHTRDYARKVVLHTYTITYIIKTASWLRYEEVPSRVVRLRKAMKQMKHDNYDHNDTIQEHSAARGTEGLWVGRSEQKLYIRNLSVFSFQTK